MVSTFEIKNLKNVKSNKFYLVSPGHNTSSASRALLTNSKPPSVIIAPPTSELNFSSIPHIKIRKLLKKDDITKKNIKKPKNWSWKSCPNITPVQNQYKCGGCWAFASAGCVSDTFVIGYTKFIKSNPMISASYILTTYGQAGCNGGNPAAVLENNKQCFASDTCIDYSWCTNNDLCNDDEKEIENLGNVLNDLIPGPAGACYTKTNHTLFCIENSYLWGFHVDNDEDSEIEINVEDSKDKAPFNSTQKEWETIYKPKLQEHILTTGTAATGFIVFNNFLDGVWTDISNKFTKGIYFENFVYDEDGIPTFSKTATNEKNVVGAHAVVVTGWGSTTVPFDPVTGHNKKTRVTYWEVRNSWGTEWGNYGGYFRMASYPFNKIAQFDAITYYKEKSGKKISSGGMITTQPTGGGNLEPQVKGETLTYGEFKTITQNMPKKLLYPEDYYNLPQPVQVENFMKDVNCLPIEKAMDLGPNVQLPSGGYIPLWLLIFLSILVAAFVAGLIIFLVLFIKRNDSV